MEDFKMRVGLSFPKMPCIGIFILALPLVVPAWTFAEYQTDASSALMSDRAINTDMTAFNIADNEAAPQPAAPNAGTSQSDVVAYGNQCSAPFWNVGVEAVWLSPSQSGHDINFQVSGVGLYNGNGLQASGLVMTPRLWLGYQGENCGIQARYWRMEQGRDEFVQSTGYASNLFKAETFDLEATKLFCYRETQNMLSGGVRYAQLDESRRVSAVQSVGGVGTFFGSAYARHEFSGIGPTLALTGLRPIADNCHLNLFYSVRGSFLFDSNNSANVVETQAIYGGAGFGGSTNGAVAGGNDSLFIGEIQIGAQWNYKLVDYRANAFFRFAFEYQYWDTCDTGSAYSISTATAGNVASATANSGDSRVNLVGFTIGTGFTW
jgi:hypothetical protein